MLDPADIEKFCRTTDDYYVNCYTLNPDRINDIAAHSFSLRAQLIRAVAHIRTLNAELTALRATKENL